MSMKGLNVDLQVKVEIEVKTENEFNASVSSFLSRAQILFPVGVVKGKQPQTSFHFQMNQTIRQV